MEDALRKQVLEAIASVASTGSVEIADGAELSRPPLRLTDGGLAILAMKLSQISVAGGGRTIPVQEVRSARTVGRCVKLVREAVREAATPTM